MEVQKEIREQFRAQQGKLTYYIIALCIAAIGFSIHTTSSDHLGWSHLPIAIAVLCWGGSAYCGLRFMKTVVNILHNNVSYFEVKEGKNPIVGNKPENIALGIKILLEGVASESGKSVGLGKWQHRLFYFGVIFFVTWHVIRMYYN